MTQIRPDQLGGPHSPLSSSMPRTAMRRLTAVPLFELGPALGVFESLSALGWQESARKRAPVDQGSRPIPWWTYAATAFFENWLKPDVRVFEFGAGNSTLWLADRVASVTSVEHDAQWADRIRAKAPKNSEVISATFSGDSFECSESDPYVRAYADRAGAGGFDVVVVDGVARLTCVDMFLSSNPSDEALLILDNSDRRRYRPAISRLHEAGFGRIDFFGPVPIVGIFSSTSFFSRQLSAFSPDLGFPAGPGH